MYFMKISVNAATKVVLPETIFPITFIDQPNVFGIKSYFIWLFFLVLNQFNFW